MIRLRFGVEQLSCDSVDILNWSTTNHNLRPYGPFDQKVLENRPLLKLKKIQGPVFLNFLIYPPFVIKFWYVILWLFHKKIQDVCYILGFSWPFISLIPYLSYINVINKLFVTKCKSLNFNLGYWGLGSSTWKILTLKNQKWQNCTKPANGPLKFKDLGFTLK